MEGNKTINKDLAKSLREFQSEVPIIHKGTKGYGYSYADLKTIIETITPILKKYKIGFYQQPNEGRLNTVIFHENGSFIESNMDIPKDVQLKGQNAFQTMGSGLTYVRRYALSSMLGLVTDIDADGSAKLSSPENVEDWEGLNKYYSNKGWNESLKKKYDPSVEKILKFISKIDNE
ncbi:hypothetical protein [uncultured Mediterranean phage uvMED]|nr:hypothetical protein [uncultured Mediterranean phage uvMED]